jgi:hypothetical protein
VTDVAFTIRTLPRSDHTRARFALSGCARFVVIGMQVFPWSMGEVMVAECGTDCFISLMPEVDQYQPSYR